VLSFLSEALAGLGYEAIAFADTNSAVSCVAHGEPFDAVLSDFKMPGMSGIDLLARLGELRPGLKGMLITGNVEVVDELPPSLLLLRKPFQIATLAEHLQAFLHSKAQ
jgi:CheY-like chemotaxis protein